LISESLDETLVVEAAAGTGKTTALVQRIVRVVAEGRARLTDIVAVTFTEKAAGELKLRLRQQLEELRHATRDPGAAHRLERAVEELEEAHVGTIHGFCADLLRERPVEASVDPLFRVLTEGQGEALFDQAFDRWFEEALAEAPEGVRRSLRRSSRAVRPGELDEDGPRERLRRAGLELIEWRDFGSAWSREPFDRRTVIVQLVALVHELADVSQGPSFRGDALFQDTEPVRRLSRDLRRTTGESIDEDLDGLEARLIDLARDRDFKRGRRGGGPTYAPGVTRARVVELRDNLTHALAAFQAEADADLAARLRDELGACVDRYEALKVREGALDYLDLLLRARDLVLKHREVRLHFQRRFTRLFIDEFQDTDPLQAELLLLLSSEDPDETAWERVTPVPGKLFIVGDPKQSIYRFRRADVDVYRRVCDQLVARGARRVELRKSFRSVPNLQRLVNAAFAPLMDGDPDTGQARYVPLEPHREDIPAQPSVVVLPVPEPYGQKYVSARQIEVSLPDAVGALVDWLVRRSGWTVTERQTPGRVDLAPRHVCLLFRRFVSYGEDVTRPYVEALEARGLKHLLVGGRAFHDRDEIEALRAALMAIEWPDDRLSVFATLRGPFFAIGDEDLLEFQHLHGRFHPFRVPDTSGGFDEIREALGMLRALHVQRNRRPITDTLAALVGHTRAHAGLVLRPGGEQALANVLHVFELARQYEITGGLSFRGFVDSLHEAARSSSAAEAPIVEESSDGVRLMTVHKAKGLEFPVVVLADLTARLVPREASRHLDLDARRCAFRIGGWSPKDLNDHRALELVREQKEGERVAYVAATRARDVLVVPAVGDGPYEAGWLSPLNGAIYPELRRRRLASRAEGCPSFVRQDSVLARPGGDPALPSTVCPGVHTLESGESPYTVVWWSPEPGALELGAQLSSGLRRDDLIVKDVPSNVLRQQLDSFEAWRSGTVQALEFASRPSIDVITATEAARRDGHAVRSEVTTTLIQRPDGQGRPGGPRFGSLVHALLADVPLAEHDTALLTSLAAAHGRILGATREEVDAACLVAKQILGHPVLEDARRAAARGQCYRETPVTLRLDSGQMVEGYVDLAFRDDGGYVVVDFKTDQELEGATDRYERQVSLYADAIARATGVPARAVLLRI
jgi:ATP-dependent exoDNAse (exonuclease V) beta subunit